MSRIKYQIELQVNLLDNSEQPDFLVIGEYDIDPWLKPGEELLFKGFRVGCFEEGSIYYKEKEYDLNLRITGCKKEIYSSESEKAGDDGILLIRYFAEAEDREAVLEIKEIIKKANSRLNSISLINSEC